jgi:UDP-N-acetylmuramoyl-tripeptide--D-alanyl-D-alanine ligase
MNNPTCFDQETAKILKLEDVMRATGGELISGHSVSFGGVCIDSRKIKEGELFIALKGDRFDGHDFIREALEKGSGAVVSLSEFEPIKDKTIISVKDTLKALQDIARFLRLKRDIPVVAVTGSNGKTTTKELIASILDTRYRVLKNSGNFNNHIGLPLSLTDIADEDEVIVLEMGASGPGEIKELCNIAEPDYGVLTNISPAHLEGFKDIETVRKTKLELLGAVGVAVVNADDPFMMEGIYQSGFRGSLVRYGIQSPADVCATDIKLHEEGSSFILHVPENTSIAVNPKISGMFNIYNLLAAASVGHLFNIDMVSMKSVIDSFTGLPMRLQFREVCGVRVISDMYNANPASMAAAVRELVRTRKGRAIAVLGDMLELGVYEEEAHRQLGRLMSGLQIDIFIAVGPRMAFAVSEFSGEVYSLQAAAAAGRLLKDILKEGDTVLIKGSRGMGMEKALEEYAL